MGDFMCYPDGWDLGGASPNDGVGNERASSKQPNLPCEIDAPLVRVMPSTRLARLSKGYDQIRDTRYFDSTTSAEMMGKSFSKHCATMIRSKGS